MNKSSYSPLSSRTTYWGALAAALLALAWAGDMSSLGSGQFQALLGYLILYGRSVLIVACVPALALLAGFALMQRIFRNGYSSQPPLALSLALGWGVLSLLLWLLAALGSLTGTNLFQPWMPLLLTALLLLGLRRQVRELGHALFARLHGGKPACDRFSALLCAMLLLVVLRQLLTALTPSFLYDVLEYHLPDVRYFLSTGSLAPIPGNAYSLMPQGAEILYAFGRLWEGGLTAFAPKLIHLYLALSTALLLATVLRELQVALWLRRFALLLFLCHPVTFILLADAYIDMATALYTTAALYCWLRATRSAPARHLALAGAFLGFALGCKYPVLGVAVLPFFALLLATLFFPASPQAVRPNGSSAVSPNFKLRTSNFELSSSLSRLRLLLWPALFFLLAYSPWLLRALATDRSPFPPLTQPWFGAPLADGHAAIRTFMTEAHKPSLPFSAAYWYAAWSRLPKAGLLLVAAALFQLLSPWSDRRRRALAGFIALGYLMWNTRTDASERFLAPLLPALILLAALLLDDLRQRLPRWSALAALPFALWIALLLFAQTVTAEQKDFLRSGMGLVPDEEFQESQLGKATARFFQAIDKTAESTNNPRVLLLYEARTAAVRVPVVANTVFDSSLLWTVLQGEVGDDPEKVLVVLRRLGLTHLAVNEVELARLLKTYPADAARRDPAWQWVNARPAPAGFDPAFLALRRYYPPYFYFAAGRMEEWEGRLDRFLQRARRNVIWEENLGGARLWLATL